MTQFDPAVKYVKLKKGPIYTNSVELESLVMHAKFQDRSTSGSGEEDFQRFLPYMDMAAILVMLPGPFM